LIGIPGVQRLGGIASIVWEEDSIMAIVNIKDYLRILPAALHAPEGYFWTSYDGEADVLYVNFKKPSYTTDSELTDDDVILRYDGEELVGLTILHASKRD
jgi:uncharacterized protein YuzE